MPRTTETFASQNGSPKGLIGQSTNQAWRLQVLLASPRKEFLEIQR